MTRDGKSGRAAGFAMRDLVAVLAAGAAAALSAGALVAGLIGSARANTCRRSMGTFATAFATYKGEQHNKLPALFRVGDPGMPLSPATGWGGPDDRMNTTKLDKAIAMRKALGSNAVQNLWLLLSGEYMGGGEAAFKCPGDTAWREREIPADSTAAKFGWMNARNFSYGLHFPYAAMGKPATLDAEGNWPELPADKTTWNWADPNGLVTSTAGDEVNKPAYPDNGIILADRNPRRAWDAPYKLNSNHEEGLCSVEKGGASALYKGADGKAGIAKDDIYQARGDNLKTGLPFLAADNLDKDGLAKTPCTDTVIWPLNQRLAPSTAPAPPARRPQ